VGIDAAKTSQNVEANGQNECDAPKARHCRNGLFAFHSRKAYVLCAPIRYRKSKGRNLSPACRRSISGHNGTSWDPAALGSIIPWYEASDPQMRVRRAAIAENPAALV